MMRLFFRPVLLFLVGFPWACGFGHDPTQIEPRDEMGCSVGYFECGGVCVDLQGDGNNCGACQIACGSGQVCSAGACQASCSDYTRTNCASSCVDHQTNPEHCGGCGIDCGEGRPCLGGVCDGATGTDGTGGNISGTGGAGSTYSTTVLIEEGGLGHCKVDGTVESTNAGFTGLGYLNSDNLAGASIEWALSIGQAGTYSIEFAYSNASEDRPAHVLVDGAVVMAEVSFPSTSSWSSWSTVTLDIALAAGETRLVLQATEATGLSNIDSLTVSGSAVSVADCGDGAGTGGSTGGTGGAGSVPACAANELSACNQAGGDIACHFGGVPGDYRVTIELGGDAAGNMYVDAEMHRRMLSPITTAAAEVRRYAFMANVRVYEGQPLDPDQKGSSTGTPGLDVYVRGPQPRLTAICKEMVIPERKVWLAGDSTVCDQSSTDYSGWGQHLPQFFDSSVAVANYADSGESSGSFLAGAKLWRAIAAGWNAGDWVLIQLGHNDKDVTATNFRSNLLEMVQQAKAAGVSPILITPISRAGTALASQHVSSTGANLPQIVRDLGAQEGVPVIDLTVITWQWLQTVNWMSYFALGTDRTHPNPLGAGVIAGLVADAIRDQEIGLADSLR